MVSPRIIAIEVVCPQCRARLRVSTDGTDAKVKCPVCSALIAPVAAPVSLAAPPVIPPDPAEAHLIPEPAIASEYKLAPNEPQPATRRDKFDDYFPVICPLCHTRMHATPQQVGQTMVCPDCRRPVTVPFPPKPKPKRQLQDIGPELTLEDMVVRPEPSDPYGEVETPTEKRAAAREPAWERPELPKFPLWDGVFEFFKHPMAVGKWITLAIWLFIVLFVYRLNVNLIAAGSLLSVPCSAVTALLATYWVAIASTTLLAVVEDTATGLDKVENWPDSFWLDDFWYPLYMINGIAVAAAPGALLAWGQGGGAALDLLLVPASLAIFFPIVILSMLESDSPVMPISLPLWQSLSRSRFAWLVFYAESGLLILLTARAAWELWLGRSTWELGAAALAISGALLLYFRLLGRLAWLGSAASHKDEEE